MQETTTDKVIKLESMKDMSIDQIVDLYKRGHILENYSQIEGLPDSPQTSARLIRYGFMNNSSQIEGLSEDPDAPVRKRKYGFMDNSSQIEGLPDSPQTSERLIRYGFMDDDAPSYPIPPEFYERWNRDKRYGFTGQESQSFQNLQGISASSDTILLIGIGVLAYLYIRRK